ncbi:MAG: DUF5522 domain-containing protein [Acidimicrobiales bacterium]
MTGTANGATGGELDRVPERRATRPLDLPHPSRLAPEHPRRDEILDAHRMAMARGEPGYLDPETGLFVLTALQLADRQQCCGSGCRHCPYLL